MLFTIFDGKIFAVSLTNNYQAQPMVKVITETMHKYFPTNGPPNLTGKYIPSNVLAKVEISSSQKPKLKIGGPSLFPSLAFTYTFSGIDLLHNGDHKNGMVLCREMPCSQKQFFLQKQQLLYCTATCMAFFHISIEIVWPQAIFHKLCSCGNVMFHFIQKNDENMDNSICKSILYKLSSVTVIF